MSTGKPFKTHPVQLQYDPSTIGALVGTLAPLLEEHTRPRSSAPPFPHTPEIPRRGRYRGPIAPEVARSSAAWRKQNDEMRKRHEANRLQEQEYERQKNRSVLQKVKDKVTAAFKQWEEALHPRGEHGKFTTKGGSMSATYVDVIGKPHKHRP